MAIHKQAQIIELPRRQRVPRASGPRGAGLSRAQRDYLKRGLDQPGGKLPLFDEFGQAISPRTIRSCIAQGWAEPWFENPIKPDWLVCRLTAAGRRRLAAGGLHRAGHEVR